VIKTQIQAFNVSAGTGFAGSLAIAGLINIGKVQIGLPLKVLAAIVEKLRPVQAAITAAVKSRLCIQFAPVLVC